VKAAPELRDYEEIFAFDKAIFDGSCDSLTSFLFVTVVAGAVEEAVTRFDRVVDLIGACLVVDFPEAKTRTSQQDFSNS
jgi:hypothetical protein